MKGKEEWRQELAAVEVPAGLGQTAERLRRLAAYRQCRRLLVSPAPELSQIRINALLDGKELIMPGPGLKDGFYRLLPYATPFTKLALAVSMKGLTQHGHLLRHGELTGLGIGLLVSEALAVDVQGRRLGDGSGFFDLGVAILNQCGALAPEVEVWAAAVRRQVAELPHEPWDVPVHGLLGPHEEVLFSERLPLPTIVWQALSEQRIKRLSPLWREWQRRQGADGRGPEGLGRTPDDRQG